MYEVQPDEVWSEAVQRLRPGAFSLNVSDGTISLSEFKAKFKRRSTSAASVDLLALIEELRAMLNDGRARSLKATFLQFDEDGNRSLTYEEFVACIGHLGTSASQ